MLIRLVAVAAMLLGTVTVGLRGAAAQDETFESDEDGVAWSVDYDGDVWTVLDNPAVDLGLTTDAGTSALFVRLTEIVDVEFPTCIDDLVPDFEESVGILESAVAEDDGAPIEGDGDGYVWQLRDVTLPDGQEAQIAHACYELSDGGIVWGLVAINPGDLDLAYEVLGAVAVDGDPVVIEFGATGDTAPDEATPVGTPVGEGTPGSASGDAATYESPSFGYTFSYDEAVWTYQVELQNGADGGRDGLQISAFDGEYALYIEGSEEWSDPDDCLATLATEIGSDTSVIADDADGDPIETSTDDEAIAAYPQDGVVAYIACYAAPEGDLIVGFTALVTGDEDTFVSDPLPAIEEITGSLAFAS